MSQLTEIRTLQDIDDEVSNLSGTLEEVQRRLLGSDDVNAARAAYSAADAELSEVRKLQRRIDGEIEGLTARITPEETRLYDGSVRNPKELASIQHEVELLKAQRSKLEDELLEVLARLETAEKANSTTQQALINAEGRWEGERDRFTKEAAALSARLTSAQAKRMAQQSKIPGQTLSVYEDVRRRRGGVAVSRVAGGNCGGCRVSIPEAVRKRAFAPDKLAQCPNCERILFVG
jgi:predicted  nucleic acid-binding Zn-ribbon protein